MEENFQLQKFKNHILEKNSNLPNLSLLLLICSYLNDCPSYNQVLEIILKDLNLKEKRLNDYVSILETWKSKNPTTSIYYFLWILGRVLISSQHVKDTQTETFVEKFIELVLEKQSFVTMDYFGLWCLGYLLIHSAILKNDKSYSKRKQKLGEYLIQFEQRLNEKTLVDHMWSQVLFLNGVSIFNDTDTYHQILTSILRVTNSNSIEKALKFIPKDDFQAWATSLVVSSSSNINDDSSKTLLKREMDQVIDNSPNLGDKIISILIISSTQ